MLAARFSLLHFLLQGLASVPGSSVSFGPTRADLALRRLAHAISTGGSRLARPAGRRRAMKWTTADRAPTWTLQYARLRSAAEVVAAATNASQEGLTRLFS